MKVFKIDESTALFVSLYTDVTNARELLDLMQAGTLQPEVAFLNASLIPDIFPVLAAAQKTLVAKLFYSRKFSKLKEFVTEQITESLKRCGISDNTTYILAAQFNASPEQVDAVGKLVKGKEVSLDELESRANHAQVQKHYKISGPELGVGSLADAIVCRIAARDAL